MIWIFKENSFEAFENNVRVTTPLALKVPLALRRGVRGEAKGLGVRLFLFCSYTLNRVLQRNAVGLQIDND